MKRKEALCVFGTSEAEAQELFSSWLQSDPARKLLVLEEERLLPSLAWRHLFFDFELAFPPSISQEQKKHGEHLFDRLTFWQIGAEGALADVKDQGKTVASNLLANLPFLEGAYPASSFANCYTNSPAIICGAGPSLERHLSLLKEAKERALLFAGGSAVKVLWENGLQPHFGAALDPNPPAHLFSKESAASIPFFFPLRVSHKILSEVHGPRIWAADGISYPLEKWLTEQLGLDEPSLEEGWNVATFCLSIAAMMGCNPIILIGVDLSLPEGKSYTAGVEHSYDSQKLIETPQGVTKGDFLLAADWIAEFIERHPHIRVINAAKEAWKIPGVEHVSLEDFLKTSPKKQSSFPSQAAPIHLAKSPQEVVDRWHESLKTADHLVSQLLGQIQKEYPADPRASGEYILHEVELEEEPAWEFLLQPIWQVWQPLFQQETSDEPYPGFQMTLQKWLFCRSVIREMQDEQV